MHHGELAPEKNREHSIKLQLLAWNVGFMRRLQSNGCSRVINRVDWLRHAVSRLLLFRCKDGANNLRPIESCSRYQSTGARASPWTVPYTAGAHIVKLSI
ncbi:hypothetical protein DND90_23945 [Pseudomonas syringae pv. maculicola]|nr:hypothetical protein DND90_23945 [Pseudomonas syringae pv. maculicola]